MTGTVDSLVKFTGNTSGGSSNLFDNGSLLGSNVSFSINNAPDGGGNL